MPKRQSLVVYMPVLHKGYLQFFDAFGDVDNVYVFGEDILGKLDYLRKDLRALTPQQQVDVLNGLGRFNTVQILGSDALKTLNNVGTSLIMPDEDISRAVGDKLPKAKVEYYPIFLRWDRRSVEGVDQRDPNETITSDKFTREIMKRAMEIAGQSSDIWRRVGAVLVADDGKQVGSTSNMGEPTPHSPWMEGDPRNIFNRGVGIEMSVFMHCESGLIAEAARRGVKLQGAQIYITDFPCPACAKLIAHSGIKTCYYKDGYAVLDGKTIMKEYGVKLVRVEMDKDKGGDEDPAVWVPYKKS